MHSPETLLRIDIDYAICSTRLKRGNITAIQNNIKWATNFFFALPLLILVIFMWEWCGTPPDEYMRAIENVHVHVPNAIRQMDVIKNPGNMSTGTLLNGKNIDEYRKVAALSGKKHELLMDELILENAANREVLAAKDMVPVLHQLDHYYREKGYIPDERGLTCPEYFQPGIVPSNDKTPKPEVEAFMLRLTDYSRFIREQKEKISAYNTSENHKKTNMLTVFADSLGLDLFLMVTFMAGSAGLSVYRDNVLERRIQKLLEMESDL